MSMNYLLLGILQCLLILAMAPLVAGIIKKGKARLQNRYGPPLIQSYYDIYKLLHKGSVVSPTVSWIFAVAPYVYFATSLATAAMLPILLAGSNRMDDLFVFAYLFALGRFFLVLASLDAGSAFGGMGGSREMFMAVLIEPAFLLAMFTVAFKANSTGLAVMHTTVLNIPISISYVFAACAFLIVMIAEMGRIPVDNPDTHLELTMIHEGMVLEYSGQPLALIMLASMVKQLVVIILFIQLFLPWNWGEWSYSYFFWLLVKVGLVALFVAGIETVTNKMRLFRVPGFIGISCMLSLLALISQ